MGGEYITGIVKQELENKTKKSKLKKPIRIRKKPKINIFKIIKPWR